MQRREAIQNMILAATGLALLPSCDTEEIPTYSRIPLERDQYRTIDYLTKAILPKDEEQFPTPEKTVDYVLTVVNDCYDPEDVEKFSVGVVELSQYLDEKQGKSLQKLDDEQLDQVFADLESGEGLTENLKYFYTTTRGLVIQHFTGSEQFMKQYLDFEFAPNRYLGCVAVG